MEISELAAADLSRLAFNDYIRWLPVAERACSDGRPLRVAVLRSYTIEQIEPILKLRLLLDGFQPTFWFGGFNQYVQEILDPRSALHDFRPDLVLLMTRIEEILPPFVDEFATRDGAGWETVISEKARELGALVERVVRDLSAQVIVQGMALLGPSYYGVFDPQRPDGQIAAVQRFNRELAATLSTVPGSFIWDFDGLLRAKGAEPLHDPKLWYVSKSPFKQSALPLIADDLVRYVRSALGRVKKCIVVDLDNTLWGGLAGEDGLEGVRLGHTYPGNCYRDFQKNLLKVYDRGILLAIDSKNNETDALRIIDEHPDMLLRRRHFAAMRINWRDKASNLREIARELNIGLESFIFIDDNPAECELIRQECRGCDVVLLPDKPYLLPAVVTHLPGVENIRLTDEDRQKGAMHQAQAARKGAEEQSANLDEFLRSLDIEVRIDRAVPFSVPRIAQLTQKTNQMNMTTRRYTEAQIRSFANDPQSAVFAVSSKDRFGDEGIVGVIIVRFVAAECVIDTFLLSCRVIGRGIEQTMLAFIADLARARDVAWIVGEFLATAKNRPAAGVFEAAGFQKLSDERFRGDVRATAFSQPAHIRLVAMDERHSEPA